MAFSSVKPIFMNFNIDSQRTRLLISKEACLIYIMRELLSPEKISEITERVDKLKSRPWLAKRLAEPAMKAYWRESGRHPNFYISPEHRENIPEGPFILAAKHSHNDDSIAVQTLLRGRDLMVPAKVGLFEKRLIAWVYRAMGAVPLVTGEDVAGAKELHNWKKVKQMLVGHVVDDEGGNNVTLIYPEGGRASVLKKSGFGAAQLALEAGLPVVPMGLAGTGTDGSPIAAYVGEAIYPDEGAKGLRATRDLTTQLNDAMAMVHEGSYQLLARQTGQNFEDVFPEALAT